MILLALVFAVLLNSQRVRFRGFFRTLYFLPVVTSLLITGLIFSFLFSTYLRAGRTACSSRSASRPSTGWPTPPG